VIPLARSHWKVASTFVALGLVGSCATAFALAGTQHRSAARRPSHSQRPLIQSDTGTARLGRRLLDEAAVACQRMSYRGQQRVVWRGHRYSTAVLVRVWHRGGSPTVTRAQDGNQAQAGNGVQPGLRPALDEGGTLWVSPRLLRLMLAHYRIASAGQGRVAGRPAEIVDLRRPDGTLAARFWLDASTKLPLRRETYDYDSRVLSEAAFTSLQIGRRSLGAMPDPAGQAWTGRLSQAELASLRARGWPLPRRLGGGLVLFATMHTSTSSGEVVELSYSDGLSLVSLFVQRGQLSTALPGWRRVTADGRAVFSLDPDERSLAWSAHGFVYTVIADAPPATIRQVVATLPDGNRPGFWTRMARGFRRLISWANPFR
jgi:sigma-E factor negative regulatory protein RseB